MGLFGAILGGVVGFFVGGPVGAAIGAGLGFTSVGEKIINKVMDFVLKPFLGAFGMPDAGQYTAQREEGVLITKRGGGTEQIPIVYGFRQVGGIITFATTGSDRNRYLWVAYVLSEGPVEGIHNLFIDDNDVTSTDLVGALNRGEQVDITTGKYADRVRMQFWYGKNFGTNASGSPVGANVFMSEAPGWRTTDAYNGLATLFVRYEWRQVTTQAEADNNPFNGNIPNIKVGLLGRRVLPIDGTSQSTAYLTDVNNNRERYSTNPAEIILDYLRNPWYGKGLTNSEIDWTSFGIARDKYNQDVTYVNGVVGPILTTNCVLDSGATLMTNVKTLLQGCRSYMPYVQGKYKLKVEDAGNDNDITSGVATVVKTFTSDNIVGDISYGGVPRDSVFSEYEVTYVDPTNKWATNTVVYPTTEAERIAYQQIDGGRVNKGSTTFPTLTNYAMAYDMARLLFNKSRQQETLNVKVTAEAFDLEPGDNIQVQGNTLSFTIGAAAIPWRVISIKANDDYTFDLGCVRNPDTIYPHTRAGERDIIVPPYIPRYDSIDYPVQDVDLSLYPPSYAYTGATAITSPLQPPGATDPTGATGGGVGDQNGNQNQNPITVPPQPAPPVQEVFNHYIDITAVSYTVSGVFASATLTFAQPDSPSYAGVDFWVSSVGGAEPFYALTPSTQIPGAGRTITYTINNLNINQPYRIVSRVKYTNGNSSSIARRLGLNSVGTPNVGDTQDYSENAGQGWSLVTATYTNPKNTTFQSISATSSLDGSSNRLLTLSIRQDISVQAGGANPEVAGVNIYYKLAANTYWKKFAHRFDGSYLQGNIYTFTPDLDLGVGTPSPDDASDNFDLIFRFTYRDNTESTVHWRYVGVDIQNSPSIVFPFVYKENTSDFDFQTEEQAPPGSVIDTRNMTIGITLVGYKSNPTRLSIRINPPDVSNRPNWYGVNFRYRKVPLGGGTAPPFIKQEIYPVPQPDAGIWQFDIGTTIDPFEFDPTEYQMIITPVVRYSGQRVEANTSWIAQGKLQQNSTNQFTSLGFRTIESAQIPEITAQPFPTTDPKVLIKSWKKIILSKPTLTSPDPNYRYYELEYNTDHIVGLTGVRIYRRSNIGTVTGGNGVSQARHFGLGRWEYIDVDTTPGTGNAQIINGNVVVNLRLPIWFYEFNTYFGTSLAAPGTTLEKTVYAWASKKVIQDSLIDIIIVATTSSGTSAEGVLLPRIIGSAVGSYTTTDQPLPVQISAYNNCVSNYKRNITPDVNNGSRANVTGATLWTSENISAANAYVAPTQQRGSAVI